MAQNHRTLKAVVIILGVLIILCLGIIVVTIVIRASGSGGSDTETASVEAVLQGVGVNQLPTEIEIPLDAGAVLEDYKLIDGHIVFRIKLAGGGTRILVHDLATGAPRGGFVLRPKTEGN